MVGALAATSIRTRSAGNGRKVGWRGSNATLLGSLRRRISLAILPSNVGDIYRSLRQLHIEILSFANNRTVLKGFVCQHMGGPFK